MLPSRTKVEDKLSDREGKRRKSQGLPKKDKETSFHEAASLSFRHKEKAVDGGTDISKR